MPCCLKIALTAGVEPAASPLGGEHSIQLSYASEQGIIAILLNKSSITDLRVEVF